ncbi:DUF3267 domain-containing protein [Aquibacillus sp. 3ASR75-11]|uniref:DUF3267 domain-containing protein n=1 Tax=Terrihalobacillus insolitus TaxID=2950438 RepID=A0A9X3WU54_9BACI|nr:DUF3267 domain-containing protein [Terrihalobacillus insolitus]MDC3425625.1 DUF3267 domain-containing protein [Terrihalobacillus insolitus]
MNCWKTVNVSREFGLNRIYMISFLLGLLSFVFLYLPLSMIHQSSNQQEYGLLPLLLGLLLLPALHKLMHIVPLILANKRLKIKWKIKMGLLPIFSYRSKSRLSKKTSVLSLLAPTMLITLPGLVTSFVYPDYFAYILLFSCVNIGMSFTDYLYAYHVIKAPRRCIIENANDEFDILIS